ncbi:MAG: nucleotide exchange factor GrpE [Planctomycetaceae bacterium]|nr:nucleotide exchange factor GrpE [Planctomycetaceae bacterium]|tara:strand:+ start:856 stop:1497 length:642 start_codon:yes stop_codon:yes gene_type:complete
MIEENENLDEVLQDEGQLDELVEEATEQAAETDESVLEFVEELTPEQQIADLQDKNVRLLAEMDNIRKRAMRDSADSRKYAALPLIHDLLAMTDNLQRALDAADQAGTVDSLKSGVEMVLQGILQIFEKYNCQLIATEVGQPFDMNLHEAVSMQPSEDQTLNTILFVVSQGYQLYDRVIRPSQVIVSSGPTETSQPQDTVESEDIDFETEPES